MRVQSADKEMTTNTTAEHNAREGFPGDVLQGPADAGPTF